MRLRPSHVHRKVACVHYHLFSFQTEAWGGALRELFGRAGHFSAAKSLIIYFAASADNVIFMLLFFFSSCMVFIVLFLIVYKNFKLTA